jgi:hypothetical protein
MTITYEFENARDAQHHIKFDYDVELTADDVISYFISDDSKAAFKTAKLMLRYLDWEKLESDEWFVSYVSDIYEDRAREAFLEEESRR